MQKTTNYELNKPEATDQYNIEHFNDNADTIDTQLKTNADNITTLDGAALKKENNLSDVANKSVAMTNVMDSFTAATDSNVNSDNIEFMARKTVDDAKTWYKTKISSLWNYIKGKASSWFGITVTESGGSITGRTFDGDVTGDISGNAETAEKLKTAVNIDGAKFDGSASITHYAACSTKGSTAAKTVTISSFTGTTLASGARVTVRFQYANSATTPTLNVSSTGAKEIRLQNNVAMTADVAKTLWKAYQCVQFVYDGTYWLIDRPIDISGNAETAAKLSNVRYINGMGFDGSQNVSCFCEEFGGVASGVFSVYTYQSSSQSSENSFSVVRGARISVKFLTASLNTGSYEIKLSVNDGTAIRIALLNGTLPTPQEAAGLWFTNDLIDFIFDGTYWRIYPKDPTPIGTIRAFGGTTAPLGYLICNYAEKLTSEYPKLQAVIQDKYGSAGTGKFRLPDLREASPVGYGISSKTSYHITTTSGGTTTTGMALGQFKDDALQGHKHELIGINGGSGQNAIDAASRAWNSSYKATLSSNTMGTMASDNSNGTPRVENTTHGKIVGVNYCIKYI